MVSASRFDLRDSFYRNGAKVGDVRMLLASMTAIAAREHGNFDRSFHSRTIEALN